MRRSGRQLTRSSMMRRISFTMSMRTRSSRNMKKKKKDHHLLCQIETTSGTPSLPWNR
jgi:hypothetical protein